MPFRNDVRAAEEFGDFYGKYVSTFESEHGQVRAYIFENSGNLVAHVSFPTGIKPYNVTDQYASNLWDFAREQGFEDRLQMIFS